METSLRIRLPTVSMIDNKRRRTFLLVWLAISIVVLPVTRAWSQDVVTRGPYLQVGTENSIVVRWSTDQPTDSEVNFGPAPGSLTDVVSDPALTVDHEITLTSLDADTKYFYAVGTTLMWDSKSVTACVRFGNASKRHERISRSRRH